MAIDAHFIHRCTIQRATRTQDTAGQKKPTWANQATGVRCRLVTRAERKIAPGTNEHVILTTYTLLVPAATDVQRHDRVANVVLEDGTTDAGPFSVEAILPRRARTVRHVSLALERVTP